MGRILRVFSALREPWYRHQPRQILNRIVRQLVPGQGVVTVRLAWGYPLKVNVDELIGATIWHRGIHDLAASEAAWRILQPGDVAVDVGANIGYMTSLMVARVGATGRIHAFEPHPSVFQSLTANVSLLPQGVALPAMFLHNTALGPSSGSADLHLPDIWNSNQGLGTLAESRSSSTSISVPVERLDDAVEESSIALLKLDVEGHEAAVLNGSFNLLSTGRIKNIIYEDHQPSGSLVGNVLRSHGYSIFSLGWTNSGFVSEPVATDAGLMPWTSDYLATIDPSGWSRAAAPRSWSIFSGD